MRASSCSMRPRVWLLLSFLLCFLQSFGWGMLQEGRGWEAGSPLLSSVEDLRRIVETTLIEPSGQETVVQQDALGRMLTRSDDDGTRVKSGKQATLAKNYLSKGKGHIARLSERFYKDQRGHLFPKSINNKGESLAAKTTAAVPGGRFTVGAYNEIRGTVAGMDAHHVGQQALMKRLVPGYDPATAPSILLPKVGHTIRGPNGIISRSTSGLDNARDVIARDIWELRRVYPDVPNANLQRLIEMNKTMYPSSLTR